MEEEIKQDQEDETEDSDLLALVREFDDRITALEDSLAAKEPETPVEFESKPEGETQTVIALMEEIRSLFKSKEEQEKNTQELVQKHDKEMSEIKEGISALLNEEDK